MKRTLFIVGLLGVAMFSVPVSAEVREFTAKDGTKIHGEIKSYDMDTDKVSITAEGGKLVQMKAENFTDEDFKYIRDWDAVHLFSQNTNFRIYLNDAVRKNKWTKYQWLRYVGKVEPSHTYTTDFNRMSYEIKFENQTGYDLENVEIKYCIFYEQERFDHTIEEKVTDLVVRPSVHRFAIVPNGLNKKFDSNSIVLRRKEYFGGDNLRYLEGEGHKIRAELIGMVFRASITTPTGQTTVREVRLPMDLSEEYVWVEPTPENTVWPDDRLDESEDTKKPPTQFQEMGGSSSGEGGE